MESLNSIQRPGPFPSSTEGSDFQPIRPARYGNGMLLEDLVIKYRERVLCHGHRRGCTVTSMPC